MNLFKYGADLRKEFSGYSLQKFIKDLMAGITVAAVALPLALAFGISGGATAAAGLVTAIIGGFIMSFLSGASYQISGPTGAMSAILVPIILKYSLHGMFITCLLAGVILLICGIFKLGRLVDYIPIPVITGFTSGIALVIAFGQIDNFFGTTSHGELTVEKIASYFTVGFKPSLMTVLPGVAAILIMVFWPKGWNAKVPGSLVAIIVTTAAVSILKPDIATVGTIPQNIILSDRLTFDSIKLGEFAKFLSPAFSVAILGMIESLLCASSASRMKKEPYDSDRELVSQGIGNIILPFFGGVPATAAIARTSVAVKSGSVTRLTGILHSVVLLVCVLFISPVFKNLPLSALSGVLMVTAFRMNEWENIKQYFSKKMKGPILKYTVTMAATVIFDLTIAIILGIIAAVAVFIASVAKLEVVSSKIDTARLNGECTSEDLDSTVVVYITGPMFFMNCGKLTKKLSELEGYKKVILSIRGVPLVDISAVSALSEYYDNCKEQGVALIICGAHEKVIRKFKSYEFFEKLGEDKFYFSVDRCLV